MVGKARGDMGFAGAFVPLVMVGTVVLMPLMAPLLIKGVTISTARSQAAPADHPPAVAHRSGNPALRRQGATKIFPAVKGLALLSTLLTIASCLVIYGRGCSTRPGNWPSFP